ALRLARTAASPAARAMAAPPTPRQTAKREQPSNGTMSSYFGPVADQIVIDAGQFDGLGIVASEPFSQALDRRIEIEDHATCMCIPYHALQPEKRGDAGAACHRRDHVKA